MNIKQMVKDLEMLNDPSPSNICYGDGYYSKSLESKYGKSICELSKIAVEYKRNLRVEQAEKDAKHFLDNLQREIVCFSYRQAGNHGDGYGCNKPGDRDGAYVPLESVKKVIEVLVKNSRNLSPEFCAAVDKHFWELI